MKGTECVRERNPLTDKEKINKNDTKYYERKNFWKYIFGEHKGKREQIWGNKEGKIKKRKWHSFNFFYFEHLEELSDAHSNEFN